MLPLLILLVTVNGLHQCGHHRFKDVPISFEEPEKHGRSLSPAGDIHGLRIFGHYTKATRMSSNFKAIYSVFSIAIRYFQRVIKVAPLPPESTKLKKRTSTTQQNSFSWFWVINRRVSQNPCDQFTSNYYTNNGFDQRSTDMVIFVDTENSPKESYIASATGCAFSRRPTYGLIIFNSPKVSVRPNSRFHHAIHITLHELTHVLGFDDRYYSYFYVDPYSNNKLSYNEVVMTMGDQKMIVSPKVRAYTQDYFGCNDGYIGGMLQNEGGAGSRGSHWERVVFRDELMTASSYVSGFRITKLTLSLLADTNFYQEVDMSLAEPAFWGYRKGCSFARGLSPQQRSCSKGCDFYSRYRNNCTTETFSNNIQMESGNLQSMCDYEQTSGTGFSSRGSSYQYNSRCFTSAFDQPGCYPSTCNPDNTISLVVANQNQICRQPREQLNINGISVNCPSDFAIFCSYRPCKWCNGHGLCVNGQCVCEVPWIGQECQKTCPQMYDYDTQTCVSSCRADQYRLEYVCVGVCPFGFDTTANRECVVCTNCPDLNFNVRLSMLVWILIVYTLVV